MRAEPRTRVHARRAKRIALLMAGLSLAGAAQATPLLYEYSGSFSLQTGPDALGLDSAQFALRFSLDTDDSNVGYTGGSSFQQTDYAIQATRLGLAGSSQGNDGNYDAITAPGVVQVVDEFPGSFFNDNLVFPTAAGFNVGGLTLSFAASFIEFVSMDFLTGPGPTPLPVFEATDVALATTVPPPFTPQVFDGSSEYTVLNTSATAVLIPEPGSLLLLALGLPVALRRRFGRGGGCPIHGLTRPGRSER